MGDGRSHLVMVRRLDEEVCVHVYVGSGRIYDCGHVFVHVCVLIQVVFLICGVFMVCVCVCVCVCVVRVAFMRRYVLDHMHQHVKSLYVYVC